MKPLIEVIFDVETKKFFDEVEVNDPSILGVSLVSLYRRNLDNRLREVAGTMYSFFEEELQAMWPLFEGADRIIGFNSVKFDVPALKTYSPPYFPKLPHFDIAAEVKKVFGRRVSLNALARETLGKEKNDSGANAVAYAQKGDPTSLALLKRYCEMDVALTKEIYDYALVNKHLKFKDHWNTPRMVELDFSYPSQTAESQSSLF